MTSFYSSPRWSGEITDCSMPMTFDTYSACSYHCQYCFSNYQRDVGRAGANKRRARMTAVNVNQIKQMFTDLESSQFGLYIAQKRPMQWGGMSDPFDEYERRYGKTLELLRFFREIEYPICFSTKAVWWVDDERYRECFEGFQWFNVKFSIITLDERKVRIVEKGCPTSAERLTALGKAAAFVGGGVTLRLRPFIFGVSDGTYSELIRKANDLGATALSTEFFCLEQRSPRGKSERYPEISRACGFDILAFYRKLSTGSGYLRLNRNVKRPIVNTMQALCEEIGMRFYVSDAHFKERCCNGSCCGLTEEWNYTRGQGCQALVLARENGQVSWSDISSDAAVFLAQIKILGSGFKFSTSEEKAKYVGFSIYDYLRYKWNHPMQGQSPYKMFEGIIKPDSIDEHGDVVYVWDETRA